MVTTHSPGHSSPEEYDDESPVVADDQWQSQGQQNADTESALKAGAGPTQGPKLPLPMQKRRRVTRACDECRRKKIKCDGKQPCTHCTVYSYECSYDQPSNRRRNPAPQYIEAIENRLHRAESLLKTLLPDIDLNDPKLGIGLSQRIPMQTNQDGRSPTDRVIKTEHDPIKPLDLSVEAENESLLESMVQNTGSLDLDDKGNWDFQGHSSGLIFIRRMRQQFGDLMGEAEGHGSAFAKTSRPINQPFDSPRSQGDSPMDQNIPQTSDLPSKAYGRELCERALDDACALMRFVHLPTFYATFDRVYDTPPEQYSNNENKYLPLIYAVMSVGSLFAKDENSKLPQLGYENAVDQGFKYFKASRNLMDITDCRDIPSLQAVIFLILFLQSSARLATCYSYIGIALHSAIRMGMHRAIKGNFNPIELETRKRMFWQIRKMDIYVGALLGLPMMLSNDDIDQELPTEVDDMYITAEKILPMPQGKTPLIAGTNAHTKLLKIMPKVMKYIYPIKGMDFAPNKSNKSYVVSHAKIREIERDLQDWMENLAMGLRPGGDTSPELARIQQLLRMAYAHVQMVLYRPFLHYVSRPCQSGMLDKRSYACAAACVSVSRNVIHITAEMKRRGLLVGAYWFTMYTTFFAILSLVFFVLENPESPTSQEILRDANEGKEILASLAKRSMAADRCTVTLGGLFDQLPEKLKRGRSTQTNPPKKRQAPSPNVNVDVQSRSPHNVSNVANTQLNTVDLGLAFQRASTFPNNPSLLALKRSSFPYHEASPLLDNYRRNSYGPYSPATPDTPASTTQDTSGARPIQFDSLQPAFGAQQQFGGNGLPDLSAMMFPSADPFAYPNQPMTTLENRQFHNGNSTNSSYGPTTPTSSNAPYDNLEVQLFGPLPPYLIHGHQPGMGLQGMNGMDLSGVSGEGGMMMAMNGPELPWGQQQIRTGFSPGGMIMDDIFGDEWKAGWADQGIGQ